MVSFSFAVRQLIATVLGTVAAFSTASAFAQAPDSRVRGEIVSADGAALVIKSRQGTDVSVHLAENLRVVGIVRASIADIKPGVFIGTSSVKKDGSKSRALEIHVFPEALRGRGEGDREWDLVPGSSMTNGTVGSEVDSVDGKTVTISYKGGERTIVIQPDTEIVTYAAADRADLRPGAKVFVSTRKAEDGTLTATAISVGKGGVTPPM